MKTNLLLTVLVLMVGLMATASLAQDEGEGAEKPDNEPGKGHGVCQFVDEDGDGFNDLAPDADGDGIPNGLDPDYVKPEDGTGLQYKWGESDELFGHFGEGEASGDMVMNQYGPGDGTGEAVGPNDGTGFGPGEGIGDGNEEVDGVVEGRQDRTGDGDGKY